MLIAKKIKQHIEVKLKRIRSYKGITQQQLADVIGKTRASIFFERIGQINKYTLYDIASALNVGYDEIEKVDATEANTTNIATLLSQQNLTEQLKTENDFLKDTINHQWALINELSKKIPSSKKIKS